MKCVIGNLTPQKYGPLVEKYLRSVFDGKNSSIESCMGDFHTNIFNFEVKCSFVVFKNRCNFVQIRTTHCIDYFIFVVYLINESYKKNGGKLYKFRIGMKYMKKLVLKYGTYAHGTKSRFGSINREMIDNDISKEYAIRCSIGDACWKELLMFEW